MALVLVTLRLVRLLQLLPSHNQALAHHFDIVGNPSFDTSRDLKYPHIPMPKESPLDYSGYSVPTSVLKKNNYQHTRLVCLEKR